MATTQEVIDGLKAEMATLKQAETDREARDAAETAATAAQIAVLQQQVVDLQGVIAGGGLTAQQQTDLQGVLDGMNAVVVSLNAADPTPPVVP